MYMFMNIIVIVKMMTRYESYIDWKTGFITSEYRLISKISY